MDAIYIYFAKRSLVLC